MSEVANISEQQGNIDEPTATAAEQVVNNSAAAEDGAPAAEAEAGDATVNAAEASNEEHEFSSPKVETKKTPAKRTPSKRMSFIERAQKESEELVKNMGGSLELEGGRRTRSSGRTPTRAAPLITPPSAKKARISSPASAKSPSRARGRGRKIDTTVEPADEEVQAQAESPTSNPSPSTCSLVRNSDESSRQNAENAVLDAADKVIEEGLEVKKKKTDPEPETELTEPEETTEKTIEEKQPKQTAVENKSEDNPDAALLKTIPEEQQNNIDHGVEETKETLPIEETPKTDSPMDVDVQPDIIENASQINKPVTSIVTEVVEKTSEVVTAAAAAFIETPAVAALSPLKEKEPTPEPMEIDSSSKSNDAIDEETTTAAVVEEKIEVQHTAAVPQANSTPAVIEEISAPNADTAVIAKAAAEAPVALNEKKAGEAIAIENIPSHETDIAVNAVVAKPVNINADEVNAVTVGTDNAKTPSLCEPKITSPPITTANDGTVSTPQYCN